MSNVTPQPVPSGYTEGNCSGFTAVSEIFTFNIVDMCSRAGAQLKQIAFRNRYGHYDYFTFQAGRSEGLGIDRQTYKTWSTSWGDQSPSKQKYNRGLTDYELNITETVVVNTGFINQPDMIWLEDLFTSTDAYEIQVDGDVRPINIVNTEFVRKIKGNRQIVNIELTYVYSNNIKILGK